MRCSHRRRGGSNRSRAGQFLRSRLVYIRGAGHLGPTLTEDQDPFKGGWSVAKLWQPLPLVSGCRLSISEAAMVAEDLPY